MNFNQSYLSALNWELRLFVFFSLEEVNFFDDDALQARNNLYLNHQRGPSLSLKPMLGGPRECYQVN